MSKKLVIMKVRPEFRNAFKLSAMKNGFSTLSEYSEYVANQTAKDDNDFAKLLCNKDKEKTWKRYF